MAELVKEIYTNMDDMPDVSGIIAEFCSGRNQRKGSGEKSLEKKGFLLRTMVDGYKSILPKNMCNADMLFKYSEFKHEIENNFDCK